jgi:hypothetical protein
VSARILSPKRAFYENAPIASRRRRTTHRITLDVNSTECETSRGTPLDEAETAFQVHGYLICSQLLSMTTQVRHTPSEASPK